MIVLKRSIAPVRELVNGILRSESELVEERTEKYFKDVYDHIIQANDLAENYRDMMMNLNDLYLSNVNLKMNEVMKSDGCCNLPACACHSNQGNLRDELWTHTTASQ